LSTRQPTARARTWSNSALLPTRVDTQHQHTALAAANRINERIEDLAFLAPAYELWVTVPTAGQS
ncbi:MAG TPA: hypothetical protein VLL25_18810, partial [Acidimicrobiales bacterium]|nr:hypothetical protein [Acidimicrobiales bacterium]